MLQYLGFLFFCPDPEEEMSKQNKPNPASLTLNQSIYVDDGTFTLAKKEKQKHAFSFRCLVVFTCLVADADPPPCQYVH